MKAGAFCSDRRLIKKNTTNGSYLLSGTSDDGWLASEVPAALTAERERGREREGSNANRPTQMQAERRVRGEALILEDAIEIGG